MTRHALVRTLAAAVCVAAASAAEPETEKRGVIVAVGVIRRYFDHELRLCLLLLRLQMVVIEAIFADERRVSVDHCAFAVLDATQQIKGVHVVDPDSLQPLMEPKDGLAGRAEAGRHRAAAAVVANGRLAFSRPAGGPGRVRRAQARPHRPDRA